MILKKGGGITLASGIFDSYSREGWFVALQNFDLEGFVAERAFASMKRLEVTDLLDGIPEMLIKLDFIAELPCRRSYLGSMGEIGSRVEEYGT
ncbi:hypothetical protein [Pseudomonas sp. P1.8]|jgi:hypothetical protein|uniref:hypothetical protein n=1 Tax=Pseudomonas sp. P1.8 TaxID=1699310 RepID=UPI00069F1E0A|nr:hypothetical protein [Pseudomonas sp. P1.8]